MDATLPRSVRLAPWDRLPDEPHKAFAAFACYRNLGPTRTVVAVERDGGFGTYCGVWSREWDWAARAAEWDRHLDRLVQRRIEGDVSRAVSNVRQMCMAYLSQFGFLMRVDREFLEGAVARGVPIDKRKLSVAYNASSFARVAGLLVDIERGPMAAMLGNAAQARAGEATVTDIVRVVNELMATRPPGSAVTEEDVVVALLEAEVGSERLGDSANRPPALDGTPVDADPSPDSPLGDAPPPVQPFPGREEAGHA